MCDLCGCKAYIDSGKQAVVSRAEEIVRQLDLAPENIELFEDCERILHEVFSYSFPSYEETEILTVSRWVHELHEPIYRERFPSYLKAAEDVLARLPVSGNAKDLVTKYHQLEQLAKEIGDKELASIEDARFKETIKGIWSVHDSNLAKKTRLKEGYGLE
ncbi:hypothetical protein [[Eubacterium] cellulosolvens]